MPARATAERSTGSATAPRTAHAARLRRGCRRPHLPPAARNARRKSKLRAPAKVEGGRGWASKPDASAFGESWFAAAASGLLVGVACEWNGSAYSSIRAGTEQAGRASLPRRAPRGEPRERHPGPGLGVGAVGAVFFSEAGSSRIWGNIHCRSKRILFRGVLIPHAVP